MPGRQQKIKFLIAGAVKRGVSTRETLDAARRVLVSGESTSQEALRIAAGRAERDAVNHQPPSRQDCPESIVDVQTMSPGRSITT